MCSKPLCKNVALPDQPICMCLYGWGPLWPLEILVRQAVYWKVIRKCCVTTLGCDSFCSKHLQKRFCRLFRFSFYSLHVFCVLTLAVHPVSPCPSSPRFRHVVLLWSPLFLDASVSWSYVFPVFPAVNPPLCVFLCTCPPLCLSRDSRAANKKNTHLFR